MKKKILIPSLVGVLLAAVALVCLFLFKEDDFVEPVPAEPQNMNAFFTDDRSFFVLGASNLLFVNADTTNEISEYFTYFCYYRPTDIILQEVNDNTVKDVSYIIDNMYEGNIEHIYVPEKQAGDERLLTVLSDTEFSNTVVPVAYHDVLEIADLTVYRADKKSDAMQLVVLHGDERILISNDTVKNKEQYTCVVMPQLACVKSKFTTKYLICGTNRSEEVVMLNKELSETEPFVEGRVSVLSFDKEFYVFNEE